MSVFKLFFKVLRDNATSVLIYIGIFIMIANLANTQIDQADINSGNVMATVPSITIFDHDKTPLSQSMINHLYAKVNKADIELEEDPIAFQRALYERRVDYILVIPEGFTESLQHDNDTLFLETYPSTSQAKTSIIDQTIEQYIANWETVKWTFGGNPQGEDLILALERLETLYDVDVKSSVLIEEQASDIIKLRFFLTYVDYIMVALAFHLIGFPIVAIEAPLMKRRDVVSGTSEEKRAVHLILASYAAIALVWLLFVLLSFVSIGTEVLAVSITPYMYFSSFVHMLAIASFALFFCHLFPEKDAVSFFSTFFSLLIAFSSGIFVPASVLWEPFHKFSSIFPTYWDVQNQFDLYALSVSDQPFDTYYKGLAIMAAMGTMYFILTLVQRRFSSKEIKIG